MKISELRVRGDQKESKCAICQSSFKEGNFKSVFWQTTCDYVPANQKSNISEDQLCSTRITFKLLCRQTDCMIPYSKDDKEPQFMSFKEAEEFPFLKHYLIEESMPLSVLDLHFTGKLFYFYQVVDGQNYFLDPLNIKILKSHFKSYSNFPSTLECTIIDIKSHKLDLVQIILISRNSNPK